MRPPLWLPLLLLAACGATGAMGQASLLHECKRGDDGCHRATPNAPLAVGARLRPDVQVDAAGSLMPVIALTTSRPDIVAIEDGALVGKAPGMAAVLIATRDGTVIDFQHVWVAAPTAIVVERAGGEELDGPVQLVAGEQLVLGSSLIGGSQRLSGEGALAWQVQGDGVSLLQDGASGRRRLIARAPGHATIVVAALGVSAAVDVEVVP